MGAVQDALLYTIFGMLAFLWIDIWQMGILQALVDRRRVSRALKKE